MGAFSIAALYVKSSCFRAKFKVDQVYEVKIDAKVPSKGGCCLLNKILSFGCTASTLFGLFMSIYNINAKLTEHQKIPLLNFAFYVI